jgi:hypothetical protein
MTVSSTTSKVSYTGNGSTTAFAVPFYFLEAADLQVILRSGTTETVQALTTNYTVAGAGVSSGGTVTMLTAPAAAVTVTIRRNIEATQETDLLPNDRLPAESLETALDKVTMLTQQLGEESARSIKFPASDAVMSSQVPAASARASKFLSFDANGLPVATVGVDATTDIFTQSGTGAVPRSVNDKLRDVVSVKDFGAVGDGAADDSIPIQNAINAAAGRPVFIPAGTYRLNSQLNWVTTSSQVFTPGLNLIGEGPDKTILDTRVSSGSAINIDTSTTLKFQLYVSIAGMKITTLGAPSAARGVTLRRAYNVSLKDVWVTGLSGDGIQITMNEGDADGSNNVELNQCRIENCAGWGFDVDVTGSHNETSFLRLQQVFIQACGTVSAAVPPTSGGMRWKGQVLTTDQAAFVLCENVGLYIQGGSGLANTVMMENTVFENNKTRSFYCDGVDGLIWSGGNIYNSDAYSAIRGAEFDAASNLVRGVKIENIVVRATSGNNNIQAFVISGANADLKSCRVRNTIWQNFDYAGQSRFVGWQFDTIQQSCASAVLSSTEFRFRPVQTTGINLAKGNSTPFRLRGVNAGSTTGEWVELQVPALGINKTNSGLAVSTRYYCYLFESSGAADVEFSTTVPVVDSASGYEVKTGDATRLYIGSVLTDGSGNFLTSGAGWLNPSVISGSQFGLYTFMWTDSANVLRIKYSSAPTSDTDGTVVGTQT